MIILDTDVFTHLTYGHANVFRHVAAVTDDEQLAVTIITRAEVLRGRTDSLIKATEEAQLLAATQRLQAAEATLGEFLLLHVDEAAAKHFTALRRQRKLNKMQRPDVLI